MTALTEFFFAPAREPRSLWTVIHWWESRRTVYNLAVGAAGLLSLGSVYLFGALPPHPAHMGAFPWQVIVAYGVLANLFYCLGPVGDLAARRLGGPVFAPIGPALFRYGFVFAVGLSLLPIPIAALSWVVRMAIALR